MLYSSTIKISTNDGAIAFVRLLAMITMIVICYGGNKFFCSCPSCHFCYHKRPLQLPSETIISFSGIEQMYGIVVENTMVHQKMAGVVIAARRVRLIVINILDEAKRVIMVGRKAVVPREKIIKVMENFIQHFKTNDFPPYGAQVWKDMRKELGDLWELKTVYNYVRGNKNGDLEAVRIEKGITVGLPKPRKILVDPISVEENENSLDVDDDEEWIPEKEIGNYELEEFHLLLRAHEWSQIRPTKEAKDRLRNRAWAPVLANAMRKQHNFECAFLAKASHVCWNFNPGKHEYFLKIHAYCADKKNCKNILVGIADQGPTENGLRLVIKTVDTRSKYHTPVTRPLNGDERNEVKAELAKRKAHNYRLEQLREMEFGENVPHNIRANHIYRQVRMERGKEQMGLKPGESIGVIQSLQNMAASSIYRKVIHDVGAIRFYAIYCTLDQTLAYKEYVRQEGEQSEIAIDASGKMVRAFEICPGKKTGHIFLYTITIKYQNRIICLGQTLTETDSDSNPVWIQCDDMRDKINYSVKATDTVKPHLAMYVIQE